MGGDELKSDVCNKAGAIGIYKEFDIGGEVIRGRFLVDHVYEYDNHGKVISETLYLQGAPRDGGVVKHERKYDAYGNEVECRTCYENQAELQIWKYDDEGRVVYYEEKSTYRISGNENETTLEDLKEWRTYDDKGKLLFSKSLSSYGDAWKNAEYEVKCYHNGQEILIARGNLASDKCNNNDEGFCGWSTLDDKGRAISYHDTDGGSADWRYDENGACKHEFDPLCASDTKYDADGNPVSSTKRFHDGHVEKHSIDKHGYYTLEYALCEKSEIKIDRDYDENGNITHWVQSIRKNAKDFMPADDNEWETDIEECYENEYYPDGMTLRRQTAYERVDLID